VTDDTSGAPEGPAGASGADPESRVSDDSILFVVGPCSPALFDDEPPEEPRPAGPPPPYLLSKALGSTCLAVVLLMASGYLVMPWDGYTPAPVFAAAVPPYVTSPLACADRGALKRIVAAPAFDELGSRDRVAASELVNAREAALDRIVAMLDGPRPPPPVVAVPSAVELLTAVDLLHARACMREADGLPDRAFRDMLAVVRLGRVLQLGTPRGPDLLTWTMGGKVMHDGYRLLARWLRERHPSNAHAAAIAAEAATARRTSLPLAVVWRAEADRLLEMVDEYGRSNRIAGELDSSGRRPSLLGFPSPLRLVLPWTHGARRAASRDLHDRLAVQLEDRARRLEDLPEAAAIARERSERPSGTDLQSPRPEVAPAAGPASPGLRRPALTPVTLRELLVTMTLGSRSAAVAHRLVRWHAIPDPRELSRRAGDVAAAIAGAEEACRRVLASSGGGRAP
jgi:hypothetical protein